MVRETPTISGKGRPGLKVEIAGPKKKLARWGRPGQRVKGEMVYEL
jgi:hypothetical protein